ncbi:MAG: hypothetical protein EKK63_01785 [Acinetobacter sp.]|uniref:hypothetical protein n=1 Tax=Acinetobacter sp. TaxID=472 RepID=UPI000FB14BFF|nr:hypothetical protein [Acinetobacter sp.]RUP42336.1 MAG: hypothetical protein EKK63_01785 [Acinetobacter sp.]
MKQFESNGSIYTSYKIAIGKTSYTVLVVEGKINYISVSKDMPNILRGSLGRDFKNFDDAVLGYKSPALKVALLNIELTHNQNKKNEQHNANN